MFLDSVPLNKIMFMPSARQHFVRNIVVYGVLYIAFHVGIPLINTFYFK